MTPSRSRGKGRIPHSPRRGRKGKTARSQRGYVMRVPRAVGTVFLGLFAVLVAVFGYLLGEEIRTSRLQARYFSRLAAQATFKVEEGEAAVFSVPGFGPYNHRLGYSYIPFFIKTMEGFDYHVAQQARPSERFNRLVESGIYPIYRPKTVAGLDLVDRRGAGLYRTLYPSHVFGGFDSIPPLLIDTLLFIEDRDLLRSAAVPTRNPAIEWDRFLYAALGRALKLFVPSINLGGGSTLATQTEKFRFSSGGQTSSVRDKLIQIVSASLRLYQEGEETTAARRRIVLEYLNSTPLSARQSFGEINSLGDGLWAWFGRDLAEMTTALNLPETDPDSLRLKAIAYREALGLILAQRRPSYYLLTDRTALDDLTDSMVEKLAEGGIISPALRAATRAAPFHFLPEPPPPPAMAFLEQKATNALRASLLKMTGLRNLYELDRLDLQAQSTLDQAAQSGVTAFLKKMAEPEHVKAIGMYGFRLLNETNDLSKINWSVLLYERGARGNKLRIQADNIDAPMDMNEGAKLDLGSTSKLRTLVTYLEIVGELYRRYAGLSVEDLAALTKDAPDVLTSWATVWLSSRPDATLDEMLQAAMDRTYSASPNETFFTGGGEHVFANFEKEEDGRVMNLREAMRDSVNLVFIRLMRDIVNYTVAQGQQTRQELLSDPDHPARRSYLERYADREGATFLNRYINEYADLDRGGMMEKIARKSHKGATARAILFRSVDPRASFEAFKDFMERTLSVVPEPAKLRALYNDYPQERYTLADRGYITGINPLELWLVGYKLANPQASRSALLAVSKPIRIESYAWLFHPNKKGAQDTRIRILLELDAFARIQQRWARLGYPFDKLVPSYATAIGSSADRPAALAELVGILLNDGVRKPMLRFESLRFAQGTPFETKLEPAGEKAVRVLDPAVARAARAAMVEVVEDGTARRLRGVYVGADGKPLIVGGKTGTGDHRFDEYGPRHRLISSRVVNRTGTIAFFIGDRFFGTVTSHVAGEGAADYRFTSALSSQMLKSLAPVLQPLVFEAYPAPQEEGAKDAPPEPAPALPAQSQPPVPVEKSFKKKSGPAKPVYEPPQSNDDLMMDVLPR